MKHDTLKHKIINLLFISGEGMDTLRLAQILNIEESAISNIIPKVKSDLQSIGLNLIEHKSKNSVTLAISTGKDHSDVINILEDTEKSEVLSPAQLQTLTLVAYLEEATGSEISFIRGVQTTQTLRLLCIRGFLIKHGESYRLSMDSLKHLGVTHNNELKNFETINANLKNKLKEALNAE